MEKQKFKELLKTKQIEASQVKATIESLYPYQQVGKDCYRYDKSQVEIAINELTKWQNGVKYILKSVFNDGHDAVRDFLYTITMKNMGFDYRAELDRELDEGLSQLDTIIQSIDILLPEKEDNTATVIALDTVWEIMHPAITRVSKQRYDAGLYADAVEAAFKEINNRIKDMYIAKGQSEKDGADLMFSAFSLKAPVVRVSELDTKTGRDIQEGYLHMLAGAMMGIRNPKAHANDEISKEDALRKLAFASMLMYKLDVAI